MREQAGDELLGSVLDLRNDPSGNFDNAVKTADAFIDKGDITVVKSRKAEAAKRIPATRGEWRRDADRRLGQRRHRAGGRTARRRLAGQQKGRAARHQDLWRKRHRTLIPLNGNGAIRLTTARFLTPSGRAIHGKGLEPDLSVSPLKLEKMAQSDRRREADLRRALKNPDAPKNAELAAGDPGSTPATPKAPDKDATTATPPKGTLPTVASEDIGTPSDEQLSEAMDVLRGLAMVNGRSAAR